MALASEELLNRKNLMTLIEWHWNNFNVIDTDVLKATAEWLRDWVCRSWNTEESFRKLFLTLNCRRRKMQNKEAVAGCYFVKRVLLKT